MNKQLTLEQAHNYWKNPNDGKNNPLDYVNCVERSWFLVDIFKRFDIPKDYEILELGSNCGRNLYHLNQNGYESLFGIEINKKAIEIMDKHFVFSKRPSIINSTIEAYINPDSSPHTEVDVIFTMATFLHIHPDSDWIFEVLASMTRNYIITIEHESFFNARIFPRNYKDIFEKLGFIQVEEITIEKIEGLNCYTARVFKRS